MIYGVHFKAVRINRGYALVISEPAKVLLLPNLLCGLAHFELFNIGNEK